VVSASATGAAASASSAMPAPSQARAAWPGRIAARASLDIKRAPQGRHAREELAEQDGMGSVRVLAGALPGSTAKAGLAAISQSRLGITRPGGRARGD
jgi:hypothetical protein